MRSRSTRALCVLLSVTLAVNSLAPWYAYADDSTEVAASGAEDYRAAGSGDERPEGSTEPGSYNEAGQGSAEAAEEEAQSGSEADGSSGGGSVGSPGSGVDGSSEDAYLYRPGSVGDTRYNGIGALYVIQSEEEATGYRQFGSSDEYQSSRDESVAYASDGGSAAEGRSADDGATEGTGQASSQADGSLDDYGISLYASSFDVIDTLVASAWSGTNTKFSFGATEFNARNGTLIWVVAMVASQLYYLRTGTESRLDFSNNYLKAIDSSGKSLVDAWGYGYGGTSIYYSDSPAGWLHSVFLNSGYIENSVGLTASRLIYSGTRQTAADLLFGISSNEGLIASRLIHSGSGLTVAGFLALIENSVGLSASRLIYSGTGQTAADLLFGISSNEGLIASRLIHSGSGLTVADLLFGISSNEGLIASRLINQSSNLTVADLLYNIANVSGEIDSILFSSLVKDGYTFSFWSLGQSASNSYNELKKINGALPSLAFDDSRLYSVLAALLDHVTNIYDFLDAYEPIDYSSYHDSVLVDLRNIIGLLTGLQTSITAWGDYWRTQDIWLQEWARQWDAIDWDKSLSVDVSGVESRLDRIADLLLMAGAKDLVDSILGEFDNLASAALMGQVQDALTNAFPFCIPAVVKQMLGLLQAPAMPPSADFDIWGAQMHLDFSGMRGFADVVGWVCRISFVAVLLLNTRRFIYTGVGT